MLLPDSEALYAVEHGPADRRDRMRALIAEISHPRWDLAPGAEPSRPAPAFLPVGARHGVPPHRTRRSPRSAFALTGHLGTQLSCGLDEHRLVAVTEALADVLGDRVGVGVEHRTGPPTQGHVKITSCIGLIALGDRLWDEFGA